MTPVENRSICFNQALHVAWHWTLLLGNPRDKDVIRTRFRARTKTKVMFFEGIDSTKVVRRLWLLAFFSHSHRQHYRHHPCPPVPGCMLTTTTTTTTPAAAATAAAATTTATAAVATTATGLLVLLLLPPCCSFFTVVHTFSSSLLRLAASTSATIYLLFLRYVHVLVHLLGEAV